MHARRTYRVNRSIVVPKFDRLHDVLTAFFLTSDEGNWRGNPTQPSSMLSRHFIRGKWKREFLVFGDLRQATSTLTKNPVKRPQR